MMLVVRITGYLGTFIPFSEMTTWNDNFIFIN
jgi:hypothetical protein